MAKLKISKEVVACSRLDHGFRRGNSSLFGVLVGKILWKVPLGHRNRGQEVSLKGQSSQSRTILMCWKICKHEKRPAKMHSELLAGLKHRRKCTKCVSRIR